MKLLVLSDTHGERHRVSRILEKMHDSCDMVVFLGDGENDMDVIRERYPSLPVEMVSGNCDWNSVLPSSKVIEVEGVRIFICHGHLQGVKGGVGRLRSAAAEKGCSLAMYGHTHCRFECYEDGVWIFNPGSVSLSHDGTPPSYGVVNVSSAGILTNVVDIK